MFFNLCAWHHIYYSSQSLQPWFNIFQSFVSIWQHNTIIWLFYQLTKLLCFTITSLFIIYTSFTQSVLIVIKAHVFSLMHLNVCWLGICLKCFANLFCANLNIFLVPEFHFIVCNINTNFIITITHSILWTTAINELQTL